MIAKDMLSLSYKDRDTTNVFVRLPESLKLG